MYSPSPIITLRLLLASSRKEPENHVSGDKVTADYTCMTILQVLHTCKRRSRTRKIYYMYFKST